MALLPKKEEKLRIHWHHKHKNHKFRVVALLHGQYEKLNYMLQYRLQRIVVYTFIKYHYYDFY